MSVTCEYFKSIVFPDKTNVWRPKAETLSLPPHTSIPVSLAFESYSDVISAVMLGDAIRHAGFTPTLVLKYFPAARQDRRTQKGESHGVKVITQILEVGGFSEITVYDPHSEVVEACVAMTPAVLKIVTQAMLLSRFVKAYAGKSVCLVAPDAGAFKKVSACASFLLNQCGITKVATLVGNKSRDPVTGYLTVNPIVSVPGEALACDAYIVVDDICDGGGTFIPMGENLCQLFGTKPEVILYVTHGLFSAGVEKLRDAGYDKIWCHNVMNQSPEIQEAVASGFILSV